MSWRILIPWLLRWAPRQPVLWGLQACLIVGFLASIGMTPLRWIDQDAAVAERLRMWLPPWLLAGILTSWLALEALGPVKDRRSVKQQVLLASSLVALGSVATLLPWLGLALAWLSPAAVGSLGTRALFLLWIGVGPAVAVGVSKGAWAERIAGVIAILLSWTLLVDAKITHPLVLLGTLLLTSGWVLLGLASRQAQPHSF